jgi:hypothetical protein
MVCLTSWRLAQAFIEEKRIRGEVTPKAGKQVHSYFCRRCRLELLLREITKLLGTPPDCPEKVPLLRLSEP